MSESRLSFLHPFTGFSYFVGLGVFFTLLLHPFFLLVATLSIIITLLFINKGSQLKRWGIYYLFIVLLIIVINPLINRRGVNILFYVGDNPVMLEAVVYSITTALSLLGIFIMFLYFNTIINDIKLFYMFGKITPKVALLGILTMRFVPLLKRRLNEIIAVQSRRGISMRSGNLLNKARNGMTILQILLTWSLEEAIQTAESMKARGYENKVKSSFYRYRFQKEDWVSMVFLFISFSTCLFLFLHYEFGKLTIYPSLQQHFFKPNELYLVIPFLLFISFPLLLEGKEWLKWKYLK
ncbi:energy-coupling factor transporter transmembrane protein EcfT [Bacillus timonensis]|nr:energy-coupling factor transporter transmembrane protein EcfT [Bacillus timonensis]